MPAWWDKISGKSKESDNSAPSSVKNRKIKKVKENETNKARSFDGALLSNSDSGNGNSSGFAGFDSSSSLDRGHPLPRPNSGLPASDLDPGHGSGSGSVSSVNSSGSSDDNHTPRSDHTAFRGHVENILSPSLRSPARGSNTSPSSPLHGRLSRISLDSTMTRRDDERSACHRLPLPPGSPTSPSLATPSPRSSAAVENSSMRCSRWRKGKLLGRGTFGHVYLGFNSQNGQMCAIKEVKVVSDDQSSKESLKQLNQEITLLSQLSHPNIVQYYGSDLSEERLSVYLEYVSGGSIHKLLQEYGSFGEPVIQNYTRQILSGLAYLHGRNTVHRDIKGANILVDPNGEIKVADFGMAKHIANCASMLSFKGSPYWMAPEVVMNTNGYSLPVDIWSLGCTVLEMATSKPPWSQYEGVAAIFKIGNSKDPPGIPDNLSADAKSFIRLCLQREPTARPTASQLLNHPFVRNQTTLRATNVNMTREAFPRTFDGSRTPTASEMYSGRTSSPFDREEASRLTLPRTLLKARDNSRTIASLPVSPSSSPLRQDGGGAYRNYFLSPPHPSYTSIGQNNQYYSTSNHSSVSPSRPSPRSTLDPWLDIPQLRPQALVRSPAKILP